MAKKIPQQRSQFYVTTPIYYVNDVPHVGHAYTTLNADVLARYWKQKLGEDNVFYLTGTDEHGQKVAQAAQEKGQTPKEYADSVSPSFKKAWDLLNIKPDFFIRTTDPRHERIASDLLQKVYDAGFIYEGIYEGLYCIGCEKFLTETDLIDGKCPLHPNKEPVFQKEKNYFLKLKDLSKKVLVKIENREYQILPEEKRYEVISRIKQGVDDISISRAGVSWGIPVPWDTDQTIYVWVEALMNYFSATQFLEGKEKFWPADLHIVGKDILWFHTVIWQALLIAAKVELPKSIFAHGFFTIDGQKMSKSIGNVISPKQLVDRYSVDGARYVILSAYPFGSDGDISLDRFDEKYNADLANGLGNLISRVAKLCENSGFKTSATTNSHYPELEDFFDQCLANEALNFIIHEVSELDKLINEKEPWKLEGKDLETTLENLVERIKRIAFNLEPFLPQTAAKIQKQFSGKIASGEPLFPRLK